MSDFQDPFDEEHEALLELANQSTDMTKSLALDMKRRQIRAFFMPPLSKPGCAQGTVWGLFIASVIAFFISLAAFSSYSTSRDLAPIMLIGSIVLGIGWFFAVSSNSTYDKEKIEHQNKMLRWGITQADIDNCPSGSQIDTWLQEDFQALIPVALQQLNIIEEELERKPPMVITTPIFWVTSGISSDEVVVKKGKDKLLRSSAYHITFICLTENRIAALSASFNFLRQALVNIKTTEFLYSDIISITTEERSTNYKLSNGKTLREAQFFRVSVANNENIEVAITSPKIIDVFNGKFALTDHSHTVNVIRDLLRDKKG